MRVVMMAMHCCSVSFMVTVSGERVMISETSVCVALRPGNNTLMAQSPCVTMPASAPSSITITERIRLLRINSKACCTEAVDGSEKTTPDFFSIQDFTEDMSGYFQAKKGNFWGKPVTGLHHLLKPAAVGAVI